MTDDSGKTDKPVKPEAAVARPYEAAISLNAAGRARPKPVLL